ncbi:hypothetical protein FHI69_02955 [Janthinobacterium lividum]|uniref:DUF6651 domain-containing protein n=1 Tax=Janthinobacterium lividum TaxID=29581 RepID=A0A5C4NTN8_9BURK|nr:DUF6651 domain-containing protein [Janthinobacterium lividum]TNC78271.1 hypothetical protein FHI69_02955 [Janthinobacterium lividum]
MPFKYNADGTIAIDGEKKLPIFIHPNGTEAPFDADTTLGTITRLNGEAKTHREAKEVAEQRLKSFDGIEDGVAALAALNTVKSLSSGELKTAAQVKEIQDAAAKTAQEQVAAQAKASATQLQELTAQLEKRTGELNTHMIGGGFSSSKLFTDDKHPLRLAIPPEMAKAYFGNNFKVEDGKTVPYDAAGNKIFSPTRPGEIADFDEGLAQLVQACPFKDQILKSSGASGSGAVGNDGKGANVKQVTRAQYEAAPPSARAGLLSDGAVLVD